MQPQFQRASSLQGGAAGSPLAGSPSKRRKVVRIKVTILLGIHGDMRDSPAAEAQEEFFLRFRPPVEASQRFGVV